jgi:hypothetical protein
LSLEKIEKSIKDLEAIKNYDEVKKTRDEATRKIKELEHRLSGKKEQLNKLSTENDALKKRLNSIEEELKTNKEASKLKDERIEEMSTRIQELENLKATVEGKTLNEVEKAFLEAKEKEVKSRADERLNSLKTEWTKTEKPKEIQNESIKWLNSIIETLRRPGPRLFLKELVDMSLPNKVEEILHAEVEKRVNTEFLMRVQAESDKKASEKFENLKNVEWPSWYALNVEPTVRQLESLARENALEMIEGPWSVTCNICGLNQEARLTAQGVARLLKTGKVNIECSNCKNKIQLSFEDLISTHLTKQSIRFA